METMFLATVLGWALVVMSLYLVFKHKHMKLVMSDAFSHRGVFFVFAFITFIIGLSMVLSHNIWVMGWPVIVTLFSWLILFSGLIRLFFPDTAIRMGKSFFNHPIRMQLTGGVLLVIGLFLLCQVYCSHLIGV